MHLYIIVNELGITWMCDISVRWQYGDPSQKRQRLHRRSSLRETFKSIYMTWPKKIISAAVPDILLNVQMILFGCTFLYPKMSWFVLPALVPKVQCACSLISQWDITTKWLSYPLLQAGTTLVWHTACQSLKGLLNPIHMYLLR